MTPWRHRPWDAADTWAAGELRAGPRRLSVQVDGSEILEGTLTGIAGGELQLVDGDGVTRAIASADVTAYAYREGRKLP